jgi:predicted aspartyl protease
MRRVLVLLCSSTLAAADLGQLQALLENNRFFVLRKNLEQVGAPGAEPLFYRGVLACRFGKEDLGVQLLQQVLAAVPSQQLARRSHEERAWAFERMGRYGDAAREWTEALRLTSKDDPNYSEKQNTGLLMTSLRDVAPQILAFSEDAPIQAARNRLGSWDVPVEVNHVQGRWIFDTGADQSTITESEARRMGLRVVETKAYVTGCCNGEKNRMRLAVSSDLKLASAHLQNVVLLVLADESLKIAPLHYQITGILGIPVIRALGRVAISKRGLVRVHQPEPDGESGPNLFFDGEEKLVVEISHNRHSLQMTLDTGANNTHLSASFRNALDPDEIRALQDKSEALAGASGTIQRQIQAVRKLRLEILDKPVNLRKVSLASEGPGKSRDDGIIGMDALWGGFHIDFEAMRLELD